MRRVIVVGSACLFLAMGFVFACSSEDPAGGGQETPDSAAPTPDSSKPAADSSTPTPDAGIDSSKAPDADAAPPAFTPALLGSRVVLWLEADSFKSIDGGALWPDKSGTGNDAVQDAAARAPALIDAAADGAINGHGVVHFAGNEYLRIVDGTSLQWAASDFAFFVVMRHLNGPVVPPSYGIVYSKWTDTDPEYPGFFMWASYPGSTGYVTRLAASQAIQSDSGLNDGVMRLVGTRRNGKAYELRVSGKQVDLQPDSSIADPDAFNAAGLPAFIGGREAAIQQLQGDIAEIVAVKGTLTDPEQTRLEGYFKTKYGL